MPARPPERFTMTQAAASIGISSRTLSLWVRTGRARVVRVSPRVVFLEAAEVDRLKRGAEVAAGS